MEVKDILNTKVFVITPEGYVFRGGKVSEEKKHRTHLLEIAGKIYPSNCIDLEMKDDDNPLGVGNILRMLGNVVLLNSPSFYSSGGDSKYLIVLAPDCLSKIQDTILRNYLLCFRDYKLDYSTQMPCVLDYLGMEGFNTMDNSLTPLEAYEKNALEKEKVRKLSKKSAG